MRSTALSLCLLLSTVVSPTLAQTSFLYKWTFQDPSVQQNIPVCQRLPITITSFDTTTNNTKGTPPYYMLAFPDGGTPSSTLIGTSESNVSYTVNYPVGTVLLLSIVDANGNPGGTYAPQTVVAGTSTDCVITPTTTPQFAMSTNVTKELSTCEPLGVGIIGGTGPYNISLVAANAPSVTNASLAAGDNIYTYINRAAPGGHLLVAISDSTGQWASGSALLSTKGATDTDCPGLVSSSSKGTVQPPKPNTSSVATNKPTGSPTPTSTPVNTLTVTDDPKNTTTTSTNNTQNGAALGLDMHGIIVFVTAAAGLVSLAL